MPIYGMCGCNICQYLIHQNGFEPFCQISFLPIFRIIKINVQILHNYSCPYVSHYFSFEITVYLLYCILQFTDRGNIDGFEA